MALDTPVAFTIFNRPEQTRRVFDAIARQKPKTLLVISDGPRPNVSNERELVQQSRKIIEQVDWACDVRRNYSEQNLGCRDRMASGISWAFEQFEELIILEDDCLPDESFFAFCENLLERYRDDQRIMMISGDNFQPVRQSSNSYYYSKWAHIWGWASWRRAWRYYDVELSSWANARHRQTLRTMCDSESEFDFWTRIFDDQFHGRIDTWDYAWMYAIWMNHGLAVLPEQNLVSNLGFGSGATHTLDGDSDLAELPTNSIGKLIHPTEVHRNYMADRWTFENIFSPKPLNERPQDADSWFRRLFGLSKRQRNAA